MSHESNFGRALSGQRWRQPCIRYLAGAAGDRPWLERDAAASVATWLRIKHAAADACGDDGLAALSSGRCDRGTRLASDRRLEAEWLEAAATLALGRP